MHRDRLLPTIFALLSVLAVVAFAAKITTPKPTPSTKSKVTSNNTQTRRADTKKVITLRLGSDGSPDKQCACTLFYLCNQDDVVNGAISTTGETCDAQSICCAIPLTDLGNTDQPIVNLTPLVSETTPTYNPPVSPDTYIQPSSSTDTSSQSCSCVPFNQCLPFDTANYGEGVINPRIPCILPDTCCPLDHIIPTASPDPSVPPTEQPWTPTPWTPTPQTPTPPTPTPSVSPNVEECGIRREQRIDTRITGTDASMYTSFGEFPWMALLLTTEIASNGTRTENVFVCGASLLAPNIILTAAHCIEGINFNLLKVRIGEYDSQSLNEPYPYQERQVSAIHVHEKFNSRVLFNDLALLHLTEDFQLASHISTVCTPLMGSVYAAPNSYNPNRCVATGWGKNAFGTGAFQTTLRKVDLAIVPRDECLRRLRQTRLGPNFQLESSFICAGGQRGADTCEGDGGGPLVCESTAFPGRYIQVGVTAWGIGCGGDIPAVYASLEANSQWLSTEFNSISVFRRAHS